MARVLAASLHIAGVHVIAPAHLGTTAIAALRARGIDAKLADHAGPSGDGSDLVAWALEAAPTATSAVELAATCARGAAAGRPVCLLAPAPRGSGRAAIERAAALAYLRAHGAAIAHDVDAWLEAVVALVRFGMPHGPRTAVIAPPGSWLEAQTLGLVAEAEATGGRAPQLGTERKAREDATDVVLFDPALGPAPAQLPGLHVPVVARAELADGEVALYGMRAALAAIDMLGRAAERIAVGLGTAPPDDRDKPDTDRLERQIAKLASGTRIGDHETKVMLAAYGVPITRQAVAVTPSATVRKARSVGYPVELKPWGHDLPSEPDGCPVERGVTSDALVRRAFTAVLAAAGRAPNGADAAVIVRETPPVGRDLAVSFVRLPALGWTVVLELPGAPHVAAAPAPLRLLDAQTLAAAVVASRAGDAEPDRAGLATLLRRASHLVSDLDTRIVRLELPRVVVGGRGARTLVVDAWAELA